MKKGQPITVFYVECLLLILVFIVVMLALTRIFGLSRNESLQAELLTNAVTLAQNGADAFMAAADEDELLSFLNENGNARELSEGSGVEADYLADMTPAPERESRLQVRISWTRTGGMLQGLVLVNDSQSGEAVYTLPLAKYVGEVSP